MDVFFLGSPFTVDAECSRVLATEHVRGCRRCRPQPTATVTNPLHEPWRHHLWPFPFAGPDLRSSATRPEMDEPRAASRFALFQQAPSKVLRSLIPLPGPVGTREGGGGGGEGWFPTPPSTQSNQSPSKHPKVPLLPKHDHEV